MLFTSPAFMFLFLPLSIVFCLMFGKNRKRLCMGIVNIMYYIFLYMNNPINIIWLPALVLYSYVVTHTEYIKRRKIFGIISGAVPVIWLVVMRCLAYYASFGFVYPVGITFPVLCASAYIWDVAYGDEAKTGITKLGFYLTFFPIMLIGPFLGYSRFTELTDGENMNITLPRCASGVKYFALGFIKRIAVGAVLIEGYSKIFAYSWDTPNLLTIFLVLILIYFGVYFSIAGYYDMAVGISRMYGIEVSGITANPIKTATVNEYSKNLLGNIRTWSEKYVVRPIERTAGKNMSRIWRICITCVCTVFFVRSEPLTLLLAIPLIAFSAASAGVRLDKVNGKGKAGLRALFGVLMLLVIGAFWVFVTMSGAPELLDYIENITFENSEYQTDMVLLSLSGSKYAFVAFIAFMSLLPQSELIRRRYVRLGKRMKAVIDYTATVMLLLMFIFTVAFFLPQFAQYDAMPFMYTVI